MVGTIRNRYAPVYRLPAALAFAGPAVLIIVTRGGFLPLAIAWWVASLAVASITNRSARMGVSAALIPLCSLTTFEGGLFMLPAVVTLLAIDVTKAAGTAQKTPQHSGH